MASTSNGTPPLLLDLTADNITQNVVRINTQSPDARLNYLMERLITHMHDFARETRLSTSEWMAAIQFLTKTGQICTDLRQEFILLSDILGLSSLVDSIDHPKPPNCTQGSVLGPFHTGDAPHLPIGSSMSADAAGEPLLALCTVHDSAGRPISGVKVDIWETDSTGHYDVQHPNRETPSERCVMTSDVDGSFWFKAIRPVSYPIPDDGPVGRLLRQLNRHCWRPSHMHFILDKDGLDRLITTLFIRGDKYETSDVVFGVKSSLIVDLGRVDSETAAKYGVPEGALLLKQDFVLATAKETDDLRDRNAMEAMAKLGLKTRLVDHLPVPDLD